MITDPVFYRLFTSSPETFFLLLGMSTDAALETAARYQFEAIEFKETAHRSDGVFRPKEPGLPLYFLEVQFYDKPSVYADLLAKAYTYLKQHDPGQQFWGVVLFGSRDLEPAHLVPYQPLLDAGVIQRHYLEEIPELANAPLGLSILYLLRKAELEATESARKLIARAKNEIQDAGLRADLIELIETVILYKLPRLSRKEIQDMLQVHDIRETRVYQEAVEEGEQKERKRHTKEMIRAISRMAAEKLPAAKIADFLALDVKFVSRQMGKKRS